EARVVADAARQLDVDPARGVLDDLLDDGVVVTAPEGGVEVDEVDPLGALVGPLLGRVDGVAEIRLSAGLPLGEAHRLAVGDIHRGQEGQGGRGVELGHLRGFPYAHVARTRFRY